MDEKRVAVASRESKRFWKLFSQLQRRAPFALLSPSTCSITYILYEQCAMVYGDGFGCGAQFDFFGK